MMLTEEESDVSFGILSEDWNGYDMRSKYVNQYTVPKHYVMFDAQTQRDTLTVCKL